MFGVPISRVREVFAPDQLTKVPLAPPDVAGVLNLRGRIVTAIDMRPGLNLPPREPDAKPMAIGIDFKSEPFALLVDRVGDVLELDHSEREAVPSSLDPRWASVAAGVHRLDGCLLIILDVDRALSPPAAAIAA
ncbi:MAG: chemotaxis protein CheW [Hansschlegelia sp.]